MTKDMTVGNPTKLLFSFAVPLLIANIFQQFYSMADAIIVGRGVGVNALAAVGVTGSMNFMVLGFVVGLAHGFSILAAQRFGAEDINGLRKSVAMSIYLSIIAAIVITTLSLLISMPLLKILHTPSDIIDDANLYISIIFAGIGTTIFYNLLASTLRALGDSKTPLYAMVIASIINIILALVFVMIFRFGVAGVAIATVIAQVSSCVFCLIMIKKFTILKMSKQDWLIDKDTIMKLLKLGVPVALMNSVTAVGGMMLQFVVNGYGSIYVAGYTAASKIISLAQQPGNAFGLAMATFTGQNIGAGRVDRIRLGLRKCIKLSMIFCISISIILIVFRQPISAIVVSAEQTQVINVSQQYLIITALFLFDLGLLFIYRSALQGMGNTVVPMISGILELMLRISAAMILPNLLGFTGICIAEVSAWIGAELLLMIVFYKRIYQITQ